TPSVTTLIGRESMIDTKSSDWPGSVANNTNDFAQMAMALYQNKQAWLKAQTIGFNTVEQRYISQSENPQSREQKLIEHLNHYQMNLKDYRTQNFIGSMFNHHLHKSTQYMAQWIEAKNKLK
ncbi:MAG: glycosyltransferase, partial [Thiomicrorhabdus sp.]|nr:glycosyltransferase [Thiomicrorhabdus sp.]